MRDLGLTNGGEATICISSVFYGGSPACACDAYVLKFLPYVFFSGNPYRGICVGDVDPNTKRVRFQLVVMNKQHFSQNGDYGRGGHINEDRERSHARKIRTELAPALLRLVGISTEKTPSPPSHSRGHDWLS
jgi:hypothetical protein